MPELNGLKPCKTGSFRAQYTKISIKRSVERILTKGSGYFQAECAKTSPFFTEISLRSLIQPLYPYGIGRTSSLLQTLRT